MVTRTTLYVLSAEESFFKLAIIGLGVNEDTADELFRQGLSQMENLDGLQEGKLKNLLTNVTRTKSPMCPDKGKVFIGAVFEDNASKVTSWLEFQGWMGAPRTAKAWTEDQNAFEKTKQRIQHLKEVKRSDGTRDIPLPGELKEMKKFREWDDHVKTYLRTIRGATGFPLAYVIREDKAVSENDRMGTVGDGPNYDYLSWDDYAIRCTVMTGSHWRNDNMSVWQIINKLVQDGPGWDYIRHLEDNGQGNGREAYKILYKQANQFSTVRLQKQSARNKMNTLRFSGDTRHYSFDKYVRDWLKCIEVLRRHDGCPSEDQLVQDFCAAITDPRLDSAISNVLVESSIYVDNFTQAQQYMSNHLATHISRRSRQNGIRNVSAFQKSGKGDKSGDKNVFSGKIESKKYSAQDWKSMSRDQKQAVFKIRKENKRKLSAVESTKDPEKPEKEPKDAGNQFGKNAHGGAKKTRFAKD